MGDTEKRDKLEALQQAKKEYRRLIDDSNEEISKRDKALVADILRQVDVILNKIAKKKKLTMILKDAKVLAYLDPKADITDLVIGELNKLQ
jgi:Skp family chaperone for outer membrane proteins